MYVYYSEYIYNRKKVNISSDHLCVRDLSKLLKCTL